MTSQSALTCTMTRGGSLKTYGPDAVTNVGRLTIPKDYYGKLQSFFSPDHPCSGEDKRRMFRKTGRYFGSYGHGPPSIDFCRTHLVITRVGGIGRCVAITCGWCGLRCILCFASRTLLNRVGLLLLGRFVFLQQKVDAGVAKEGYPYGVMEFDSPHGQVILEFLKRVKRTFSLWNSGCDWCGL